MKRSNTQSERQIDIDRRIRAGEYPSIPQLAAHWEVSERTIKRDIEFMRDRLHAPIEYDRGRRGYFYTEPIWAIPAIYLQNDELTALLIVQKALEQCADLPFLDEFNHFCDKLLQLIAQQNPMLPEQIRHNHLDFALRRDAACPCWRDTKQSIVVLRDKTNDF